LPDCRLAHNEEKLVVATADGAGICLYNLREILSGDVGRSDAQPTVTSS
jgi:hypothetical protein